MTAAENRKRIGRDLAERKPMPAPMPSYNDSASTGRRRGSSGTSTPMMGNHGVRVA